MSDTETNIPSGNNTNVKSPATAVAPPVPLRHDPPVIWMILVLAAVFVWRIFFTYSVNLIPDECSYWAWSRRLDWSYFDNSGMVAYLIRLSTSLFNESAPVSVRFPFLILSGLT